MNLENETDYRNGFIQARKTNKQKFMEKLKYFRNTSNIAVFDDALIKSFELLLENRSLDSESSGCNKVIMIITDGASENGEEVFKKYNWDNGRRVRVFTFLIGRDMTDPRQVQWMACANDGAYYHVATLADVNEHVYEYLTVLSHPMALNGVHETTWSNVFVGQLDKELKIAVARPAFKRRSSLLAKLDTRKRKKGEGIFGEAHQLAEMEAMTTPPPQATYNYDTEYTGEYTENYQYYDDDDTYDYEYDPSFNPDISATTTTTTTTSATSAAEREEQLETIEETLRSQQVIKIPHFLSYKIHFFISDIIPK
jgi:hypothetical protein